MRRALLAVTAVAALAGPAAAQDPWGGAWTPLAPVADIPRSLLTPPSPAALLVRLPPAIGLFWTDGNPAALPFEVGDAFSVYDVGYEDQSGDYRRPLDPGSVGTFGARASGWGPLGGRGGVTGRAVLWDETREPDALSHQVRPYGSSPLIASDSSTPAVDRVRVRLEGAGGWRTGPWGFGAALGYDAVDNRTQATRLPRIGRQTTSSASLGAVHAFGSGAWRVGLSWRYQQSNETFQVTARGGTTGAAFLLIGFSEPLRQPIVSIQPFIRRFEREASAWSPSVAGTLFGATWTAALARERLRDEQRASAVNPDVGTDRWLADGWAWTVAAQRPFRAFGWTALARAGARGRSLEGDATIATIDGIILTQRETDLGIDAELRVASPDTAWQMALGFVTRGITRDWADYLAELSADIETWTPGASVEVARRVGRPTDLALGFAWAGHFASARLPNPALRGPAYQQLIAPELSLEATQAAGVAWHGTLRYRLAPASALWIRLRYDEVRPRGDSLPLGPAPEARRKTVTFQLGLTAGM